MTLPPIADLVEVVKLFKDNPEIAVFQLGDLKLVRSHAAPASGPPLAHPDDIDLPEEETPEGDDVLSQLKRRVQRDPYLYSDSPRLG